MSFRNIITDQGTFYAITSSGELLWYRDLKRDGTSRPDGSGWAPRSSSQIGIGWEVFSQLFSGGNGIIYGIKPTGELLWYRDLKRDGTSRPDGSGWHARSGSQIGVGWHGFSQIFSGGNGVIYAIKPTGELLWYRDVKRDGTSRPDGSGWDPRSGSEIGIGWHGFAHVFSGGNGVIYAIKPSGELLWYRDVKGDGTSRPDGSGWDPRSGSQIGVGWKWLAQVFSGGNGIIYAITVDGLLLYCRDQAEDGTPNWAYGGKPQTIGTGWLVPPGQTTTLAGYCAPISVAPGETIEFKVSARVDYDVTYLRLKTQEDGEVGIPMQENFSIAAGLQDIPPRAWQDGCGWKASFTLVVPAEWTSGMYAARCTASDSTEIYLVFVVKPDKNQRADLAVLANTNTWNAYNEWGGKSKYNEERPDKILYSEPPGAILSFERPNPGTSPVDDGRNNHLTRAELWVLGWLEDTGYTVDVYSDQDFHAGIDSFESYKALIMTTHPEYWTMVMLDNLESYLSQGGNLLYMGGNGIYERVDYDDENNTLVALDGDPTKQRQRCFFRNLTPPRPERAVLGVSCRSDKYDTHAPFQILMADHRFFKGTGLTNGDEVGHYGLNGAASGWEVDTAKPGNAPDGVIVNGTGADGDDRGNPPDNLQVLARATDPGDGADITYYETDAGGFVFAAGSITFGGSLVQDANLQLVVKNVLDECLGW